MIGVKPDQTTRGRGERGERSLLRAAGTRGLYDERIELGTAIAALQLLCGYAKVRGGEICEKGEVGGGARMGVLMGVGVAMTCLGRLR